MEIRSQETAEFKLCLQQNYINICMLYRRRQLYDCTLFFLSLYFSFSHRTVFVPLLYRSQQISILIKINPCSHFLQYNWSNSPSELKCVIPSPYDLIATDQVYQDMQNVMLQLRQQEFLPWERDKSSRTRNFLSSYLLLGSPGAGCL